MKRVLQDRHRDLFDDAVPAIPPLLSNRKDLTDLVRLLLNEIAPAMAKTGEACDDEDHA
ncbi:MAG: hypothetical protein KJ944_17950 [Alphaproteobacteria bacterium]|nr:hypothetical protein [Alphaproteobacteria bacterium]MBU2304475.1 hypothetical protein [Alphaproteobacteria bacterium]MBU2366398.1 hypothetical protein [Alphaproteobacteria bacterium]